MGNKTAQKAHEIYETKSAQIQKSLYIQAFIKYEELKNNNGLCPIKGTLVQKKQLRKREGKIYRYTYHYLQVSEYVDGTCKTRQHYIPKENVAQVKEALQQRGKVDAHAELAAFLQETEKQLQKYIRKGLLPDMETLEKQAKLTYEAYRQAKEHRQQQVASAQENSVYKIVTEAGELVVSKNECIIANMLYHKGIPYFYEKPLPLKPRRDGKPVVLHPDFTVRVGGKEIYIEILGMMTKEEYATSWEYRLATYKVNGIRLGENLVALKFPSAEQGQEVDCWKVDCRRISQMLDAILKNKLPQDVVDCGVAN